MNVEIDEKHGERRECHDHERHHPHPHLVAIEINRVAKEIETGRYPVAQIKKLGDVPLADELDQVRDSKPFPLHDDGTIEIEGGEIFLSQPRSGGSS